MRCLALIAAAALLAAGCGQRGPLYLRDQPPPGAPSARPETRQPVPYPADDARRNEEKK